MHRLLQEQLRQAGWTGDGRPFDAGLLLRLVDAAYRDADAERRTADASIEVMSDELARLRRQIQAETSIRRSERRFQDFVDGAADWLWETDATHRFVYLSERMRDLGVDVAKCLDRGWSDILRGAAPANQLDVQLALMQRGEPLRDLVYQLRRDGETRWLRVSGKPNHAVDGSFAGYRGVVRDITDLSARERALGDAHASAVKAQERLATAIERFSDGVALFDGDDRLVMCNQAYRNIHPNLLDILEPGVTFEEIVRTNVARSRFDLEGKDAEAYIERRLAQHRSADGPVQRRLNDGRWELARDESLSDGGRLLVITDITERKRTEEALIGAKLAAEAANRAKSQFLANMSHELRTPLNAIIGFSEVLAGELFGPIGQSRYGEYARDILASGKHLLDVINDILDVSKIDAGKFELAESELDLAQVADAALLLVRGRAAEKELSIGLEVAAAMPRLKGDERALKQVLINLLSNAIKFTPAGGRVSLTVDLTEDGRITLAVRDSGIGMAAHDIPRALEPFQQLDSGLDRRHEGTGLGLPLCKRLVELHGGEFRLQSELGVGTSAIMVFPAARTLAPSPAILPAA